MDRDYRITAFINNKLMIVLYISVIFSAIFSIISPFVNNGNQFRIIAAIGMAVFVVFHGIHRYGWKIMMIFFVIIFFVTWSAETLSILTGFPFGNFYYTDLLGAKAGTVPWGIMLEYFFVGYLTWTIAGVFLKETTGGVKRKNVVFMPILSAIFIVLWNSIFDPVLSTIEGNWIWIDGGSYFGVPVLNFVGWFLTTYVAFQIFALFLAKINSNEKTTNKKGYWFLVPILFFVQSLEYLIHPFLRTVNTNIYTGSFLTTVIGVLPITILCVIFIYRRNKKQTLTLN